MEERKEIGRVSEEERDEIKDLFDRRNGLIELAKILSPENEQLYNKLVKDMAETSEKFNQWWDRMSAKYHWESSENGHWEIDFDDCTIYLRVA
jgi:hypothetical protein